MHYITHSEEWRTPPAPYAEIHSLVRRHGIEKRKTLFIRPGTNEVFFYIEQIDVQEG